MQFGAMFGAKGISKIRKMRYKSKFDYAKDYGTFKILHFTISS